TFETVTLNGGTALAGKQNPDDEDLGSLTFVLGGVEIRIFGPYDEATLQAIAQSIVDRSTSASSKIAGLPQGPSEVPISLSDAAAALGAPVVLPHTPLIALSKVGSVEKECPGPWGKTCAITVMFPSEAVQIRYSLGGYPDPLREYRAAADPGGSVIYLSGVPALLRPQDPNDTAG